MTGCSAICMFGSGQWTIWEGYAAAKLFKGGFRSNNLDPNARHCMNQINWTYARLAYPRAKAELIKAGVADIEIEPVLARAVGF